MRQAPKGQHKASRRSQMLFLHLDTSHRLVGKRKIIQTFNYRSPEQRDLQQVIATCRKFDTSPADDMSAQAKFSFHLEHCSNKRGKKIPKAMTQVLQTVPLAHQIQGGVSPHAEANSTRPHFLSCSVQKKSQSSTLNSMRATKY